MSETERIISEAMRIWNEREQQFPAFTRMDWQQGSQPAREATLWEAMRNLGIES